MTATLVVGTGLIGTSAGLALRAAGREVLLADADAAALAVAVERGAGVAWVDRPAGAVVEHVLLATPPAVLAGELERALSSHLDATVSDVASIKSLAALEVETSAADLSRFAGSHPMAGSERGGAGAARADLFVGRPWAVTRYPASSERAVEAAVRVAADCGAVPVLLTPAEHDGAVALVSHLPQLTASALAALVGARASESALGLVGQGLRDTTRIASSPPALWGQILERNAAYVSPLLRELAERLTELAAGLEGPQAGQAAFELIAAGNTGVERLPGKHSAPQQAVDVVMVLLKDVPGALVAVLSVAHDAGVNVEDIRIEHVPGAAVGSAALVVVAGTGDDLAAALGRAGWSATVERPDPPR